MKRLKFTIFGITTYVAFTMPQLIISTGWRRDISRIQGYTTPKYRP